jgi:biotin transport system substrate-specific component
MPKDQRTAAAFGAPQPRGLSGLLARPAFFEISLVAAGVGVLTIGAWLSVPFYPVPLTMQTLAVLLVGGLLGPRLGVAAVFGYLALGFTGAPVFHNGLGGPAVLLGPTGGYLLGFLPAAFLMGLAARLARGADPGRSRGAPLRDLAFLTAGGLLAEIAIYVVGVPWLATVYAGGSLSRAIAVGAVPYFLGDLLKTAVAVGSLHLGTTALSRRGSLPF